MAARTMALDECIRHDGVKMWMELREMPGQAVPVVYYSERMRKAANRPPAGKKVAE